jgi:hypothetical protein
MALEERQHCLAMHRYLSGAWMVGQMDGQVGDLLYEYSSFGCYWTRFATDMTSKV